MKFFDIRDRVLMAALLPVTLMAFLLSAVFLLGRVGDLDEAHGQRARSLARQVASASEYGIFSGNTSSLQAVAAGALREPDVRSVVIQDVMGNVLARAGKTGYVNLPLLGDNESEWNDETTHRDVLVQPVTAMPVRLDDAFDGGGQVSKAVSQVLGHVVIEMSRQTVVSRERDMLMVGLAVTLGGLLLGGFLAVRIGQGVIDPILRVSDMIERLGRGELSARGEVLPNDPLRDLQQGLNQMAERLEHGRDELEQRVDLATLALREKKEEAETATLAKSRFLAAASHDLRQPTHALGMFVARLAQLPHDAETRHLIVNLEASVRAMQDLLDSLLDISRLDADAIKVHLQAFPIMELLEPLRGGLSPVAAEKGLRLRVRPCEAWVLSDPILLSRILLNLVSNALRYTRHGGVLLACRPSRDGNHLRIEVWDSGIGIAPEHQQDIFKEFFQLANPERDRSKGLGLGLHIVDRTAKLLGHPLRLTSVPGRGTRFSIEVPTTAPSARAAKTSAPSDALSAGGLDGLQVLVIEDDRASAQALSGLLTSWGCTVVTVEDLQGALSAVSATFMPQVILSDYRLRDRATGVDTLSRLRAALGRPVPACLMSGDTDPSLMQVCRDAGVPLLHKPVRPAKLRTLLRRLVPGDGTVGTS
ncbi:MAG: hybrid sensor histidine kinase/response regulator [Curvibacter sp. PD_MW3]|nr:MAG: hybrid sensor histidine kinase/response regulator [Curvibacter sp. PD_MW3]